MMEDSAIRLSICLSIDRTIAYAGLAQGLLPNLSSFWAETMAKHLRNATPTSAARALQRRAASVMRRAPAQRASAVVQTLQVACLGWLVALMLTSVVAMASYVSTLQFGPQVGDLLQFPAHGYIVAQWKIAVRRIGDGGACALQPKAMAAGGGSLVVERRLPGAWAFQVHWAGARTSNGPDDCGRSADLDIAGAGLQSLLEIGGAGKGWAFAGF